MKSIIPAKEDKFDKLTTLRRQAAEKHYEGIRGYHFLSFFALNYI